MAMGFTEVRRNAREPSWLRRRSLLPPARLGRPTEAAREYPARLVGGGLTHGGRQLRSSAPAAIEQNTATKPCAAFQDAGWTVFPIHPTLDEVEGIPAFPSLDAVPVPRLDQVSFYVPPSIGIQVLDQVARKEVGQLWLNPGSESPEILARARNSA